MKKLVILLFLLLQINFILGAPSIDLNWLYPTSNISVSQNNFFNVSVNVTCRIENCGNISISLDPPSTNYTFTSCGATGRFGPNQTQCNTNYTNTTLQGAVTVGNGTIGNGTQNWTVPTTGFYRITAYGARGAAASSYAGGFGANISGTFLLSAGTVLKIVVGQAGVTTTYAGGGGGSYVTYGNNTPLIVAGGGGAGNAGGGYIGRNATLNTSGGTASNGGTAATGGSGGNVGSGSSGSSGGGGLLTSGSASGYAGNGPGLSFVSNSSGGASANGGAGGFGGGSGGDGTYCGMGGAGGGYSGGTCGTCSQSACGGGGSYNGGTDQNNSTSLTLSSMVFIELLSSKNGLISTTVGATPFYTNVSNPYNVSLNVNQSQTINWWVNATGGLTSYQFFAYANLTSNMSITNVTSTYNITTLDTTAPIVSILYPTNTT